MGHRSDVYRYHRVRDWLYGIRAAQPDRETQNLLTSQPLTEAERYRVVYHMITSPREEGGAGITPKHGHWKDVESIFPLHDHAFNKEWIKTLATMTFLKIEDLDDIRNRFGEKVAYYFAFTQSYFAFLIFPAAFGFSAWVLLGHFSAIYAVVNCLWSVTFVEYWKRQEVDLAVRWGVKGVSAIQEKRREFQHEKEVKDPITGETVQVFPATKRLGRQLLQLPFAILASLALGTIIATCFGIEIFLSEVYNGPFKSVLVSSLTRSRNAQGLMYYAGLRSDAAAYWIGPNDYDHIDRGCDSIERLRKLGDYRCLRLCNDTEDLHSQLHHVLSTNIPYCFRLCSLRQTACTIPRRFPIDRQALRGEREAACYPQSRLCNQPVKTSQTGHILHCHCADC